MLASVIPSMGQSEIPGLGLGYRHSFAMKQPEKPTPRQILSTNLKGLMAERPGLETIKKVVLASDSKLSNGKVGRIVKASHTTDIDTLRDLAAVFSLEPWQLLVEGLNPASPPVLIDAAVIAKLREVAAPPKFNDMAPETHGLRPPPRRRKSGNTF
jgi:hypothetical protein